MSSRNTTFLAAVLLPAAFAVAQEKITYQDHVRAIFNTSCISCHNPDKNSAGLNLTSYQGAMSGSSNGKVLNAGDPDGSKLFLSVTHREEPKMPRGASKLSDAHLETIRKWIEGGLLETASSVAVAPSKPKLDMTLTAAATGRPKGEPPMPKGLPLDPIVRADRTAAPAAMAASPWAPLIAMSAPHQVLLYHAQTRELLGVLPFNHGQPKALNFSRSGALLMAAGGIGGEAGKLAIYDVATGRLLTEVGDDYDELLAADISPDQSAVAFGGPTKVLQIYSIETGEPIRELEQHTDWILAVAYSPDGVLLASGDRNGGLRVWEAVSGNEFYTLNGHKAAVTSVRFRADSNVLVSASEDGTVKLWDMNSGEQIKSWAAHPEGVLSVDFAPDGRLVTAGRDRMVRLWKPDGAKLLELEKTDDLALQAVFAGEGALVAAADFSGEVRVHNAADGKPSGQLDPNPPTIEQRLAEARRQFEDAQAAAEKAAAEQATGEKATGESASAAAEQLAAARAELLKWKKAKVASDLAGVQQEVEELTAAEEQVANALAEIEAANKALTDGPARLAAAEQRLAKAKEASPAAAAARAQAADTRAKALEPLVARCEETAKALQAAASANAALADAAKKSAEAAQLVSAHLAAARKAAESSAAEAKQAADDLAAAEAELAAARSELEQAPRRLEEAKALIAGSVSHRLERAQARLEALTAEAEHLENSGR